MGQFYERSSNVTTVFVMFTAALIYLFNKYFKLYINQHITYTLDHSVTIPINFLEFIIKIDIYYYK